MGRILLEGWEAGEHTSTGWELVSGTPNVTVADFGVTPRKDFNGNGGSYFLTKGVGSNQFFTIRKKFSREAREFFLRFAIATPSLSANDSSLGFHNNADGVMHGRIEIEGGTSWGLRTPNTTDQGNSPPTLVEDTEWRIFSLHYFIDDSTGFVRLFKEYDYSTFLFNYSGDTRNGTTDAADVLEIFLDSSASPGLAETALDDLALNDITMSYTSGVGLLPAVGDSILGQSSSARAVITAILPGSTIVTGTLQLRSVQDVSLVSWTGILSNAPFSTEVIDDTLSSNLWTANITGLDKNSGFPDDGYIIGLSPNGSLLGSIQLAGSDGNSIDNHLLVDDVPANDAEYVETATSGDRDLYELENFPLSSGDINDIAAVSVSARWRKTNTVLNNGKIVIEHSSVEYDSEAKSLPLSTFGADPEIYDKIPDGTDWNITNIDSLKVGPKFE